MRYWGSRPDLCTKLRVTVGQRASNAKFIEITKEFLGDGNGHAKRQRK